MCVLSIALLAAGIYLMLTPEGVEIVECPFCCHYGSGACQAMGNDDPGSCGNLR